MKIIPFENSYFDPVPDPGDLVDRDLTLRLRETRPAQADIQWVAAMVFDMFHTETGTKMGYLHLRFGVTADLLYHGGQIGYGVEPEFRGHRYAARSVPLVLPLAARAGMEEIWITCDPANIASRRSLEIAGGELVEIRKIATWSPMYQLGRRESCRFHFPLEPYRRTS
jgi:predicted acetyltransferase